MTDRVILLGALLIACAAWACSDFSVNSPTQGKYTYWAFDDNGTLVARGEITLTLDKLPIITGQWEISALEDADMDVPHGGEGRLVGSFADSLFSCDLHPGFADNNILLNGEVDANAIWGQWQWVTFAGPTSSGPFIATKK